MKKIDLKNHSVLKMLSLFGISLISYFANAQIGKASAYPIWFILLIILNLPEANIYLKSAVSFISAWAFSVSLGEGMKYAFLFSIGYALVNTAAYFGARTIKYSFKNKKILISLSVLPLIALFCVIQYYYAGSINGNEVATDEINDYLSKTYLNQEFTELNGYYDCAEKEYVVRASFPYGDNTLVSNIYYNNEEKKISGDDFYSALCEWGLSNQKGKIISALRENISENFSVDALKAELKDENGCVHLKYGDEKIDDFSDKFEFSVTFGTKMTQKRFFAEKCREYFESLKDLDFGKIEFIAENNFRAKSYSCIVTPKTDASQIYDICIPVTN